MDNIRLNFDGDINKLKEQINNLPYEQREALKDVIDVLPIKIGLGRILRAVTESMLKTFPMEDLMKVPTFSLLTLLEELSTTNADELVMKCLIETGVTDKLFEMIDMVKKAEEEAIKHHKDREGSSIEEVLKNYVKNNQN